jgi:hypothetical protein
MIQQLHSWGYTQIIATQVIQRHLLTPVYCSTMHNGQIMEKTKMPHY